MCFSICITSTTHMVQMLQQHKSCGTMQSGGQKSIRSLLKARWNLDQDLWLWLGGEDDQFDYFVTQIHALGHPFVQDKLFRLCPGCRTTVPNPSLNGLVPNPNLNGCGWRKVLMKSSKFIFFLINYPLLIFSFIGEKRKAMKMLNFKDLVLLGAIYMPGTPSGFSHV